MSAGSTDHGDVAYYASKVINAPNGSIEGDYIFGVFSGVNTLCEYIGNGGDIVLPADYKGENYKIGSSAFEDCTGLTSVTIGHSVTTIGSSAFEDCYGLKSVIIGNSVTSIGEDAFSYCSGLTSITIPNSVTTIGDGAFYGCDGLTSIEIPNNVTCIGSSAFYDCDNLASVTIGNGVKSVGSYAFYACDGLKSVIIGNSVTSIGEAAFEYCDGLKSITIPNSVTTIGARAFLACYGLTSVTIGNGVTNIGGYAFAHCTGLKEIYSLAKTPPTIDSSTFGNYTATLYVPEGAKSVYQAANYLKKFTNIVEMKPEFATGDINGDEEVNVGDFATLVNAIFDPENTDKAKYARADVNKDSEVNVGDFAALVNVIFGGSSNAAPKKATATRATTGEHRLYIEPFNIAPGERAEIAVLMENTGDKFSQMQFDLTLPEGISIVQEFDEELFGDVPLIKHCSRTSSKAYDITCRPEGDGVKIMCATENINAYFLRESGDVLLITVEAAADLAFGTYELTISNSVLARQDDSTYKPASETAEITVCDLTGIDSIEAEEGAAEIYDIYGRRVTEPVKGGVYIVNGKKVVVE